MEKEKLTIEQLTPFLAYGLTGMFIDKYDIVTEIDFEYKIITSLNNGSCEIKNFKPALLDISYLTKEVEVHGERFRLIDKINSLIDYKCAVTINFDGNLIFNVRSGQYLFYSDFEKINNLLFEYHFDVFGLIEKGLAINKNTP